MIFLTKINFKSFPLCLKSLVSLKPPSQGLTALLSMILADSSLMAPSPCWLQCIKDVPRVFPRIYKDILLPGGF